MTVTRCLPTTPSNQAGAWFLCFLIVQETCPGRRSDSARDSDVLKRLLQNLGTIGNNLAELRGLCGTGHGKHGQTEGLKTRHARLAVVVASALAIFLFETHKETKP